MDLIIIVALTLLLPPLVYVVPLEPGRVALGVLLVLFFPGYVFLAVFFPRQGSMDTIERVALSIGFSLAFVPLFGLGLHFTPWGIRLTPIVITLSLWTVAMATVAWVQRMRTASSEGSKVELGSLLAWARRPRTTLEWALGATLTIAGLAAMGVIGWNVQNSPPVGDPFTEFYVLGTGDLLKDYPTALRVSQAQEYNLGIVNQERKPTEYTVRAFLGADRVGAVGPILLAHGEKWEGKVLVTPLAQGEGQRLEFRLFRDAAAEVHRSVHLSVQVSTP